MERIVTSEWTVKPTTKVFVVEDNRLAREGLVALLKAQKDLKIVGAAEGVNASLMQIRETQPRVVLVDASLRNQGSYRFVESVRNEAAEARVVVIDLPPLDEAVVGFAKAGATGFVAKRARINDLVATVRSVAGGADVVPTLFVKALFSHIAKRPVERKGAPVSDGVRISKREGEVIALIAEGLCDKDIAQRLHLATATVKSHVHNILQKLAMHNRVQIAAHAHRGAGSTRASQR